MAEGGRMNQTMTAGPVRLVFWETTAGCNLRCIHCRRIEVPKGSSFAPGDLTTSESKALIDQIVAFANPILVLSGGEPLLRPDIFEIASYATSKDLRVALATNATLIDAAMAAEIVKTGVKRVSISIDGSNAETHDAFRGIPDSFEQAWEGFDHLKAQGMSVQINTTITRHNVAELPEILKLTQDKAAAALHIFLLVPVGCGVEIGEEQMISPEECEKVLSWLGERDREGRIDIKATCAPHYYRITRQQGGSPSRPAAAAKGHPGQGHPHGLHAVTKGCLAGTGVCFVSHKGDVFPCGYLPIEAGSIHTQSLQDIWEGSPLFAALRDSDLLTGKCGICEFKNVCGGCRARAYAETGSYLTEEPYCVYQPGS